MSRESVAIVFLAFALTAFAGCAQKADIVAPAIPTDVDPNLLAADGRDLRKSLKETDVIEAPQWALGDWFGHHVLFEGGPDEGLHINTIIVEDKGDQWMLATDDKQMAKLEAAFDIPIIGAVAKKDLSSTGFGAPWEPYVFPLKHGATWTREVTTGMEGGGDKITVNYAVTFNPAISTPDGSRPGFDIKGTTDKGLLFAYDFVPDIQWYAHFYEYNLDTEAADDFIFHVMSMGRGNAWSGTYYIDAATSIIAAVAGHAVNPDSPSEPWVQPDPYKTFTVPTGATYVYGFVGAGAFAGASELLIIDPKNERYEFQAIDDGTGEGKEANKEIDLPAVAGEWKAVKEGVGAAIWNYVVLWAITETAHTL